jgi:hypothetical protein
MADEAFALSPISARAAMPGEADYDAISAAFMETSRGRWFLSEYAKRNRNADTRMVLDAVARIEQSLAAQKEVAPEQALTDALAAIREAVDEARAAASTALGGAAADESLAPIRGAAQVIRETLLRLREIGVGGRIYDLMDSQVNVIEAGCRQIASIDARAALSAAFDLIDQRIRGFADDDIPSSVRETPPSPSATFDEQAPAAMAEFVPPFESAPETATAPPEDAAATAQIETAATEADIAHDETVLDLIALEMAAPDFDEPDIAEIMEANSTEPEIVLQLAERPQPEPAPIPQPSLGASLIANGIVRRPDSSYPDPLAPIRRMSQAEKIAFFS